MSRLQSMRKMVAFEYDKTITHINLKYNITNMSKIKETIQVAFTVLIIASLITPSNLSAGLFSFKRPSVSNIDLLMSPHNQLTEDMEVMKSFQVYQKLLKTVKNPVPEDDIVLADWIHDSDSYNDYFRKDQSTPETVEFEEMYTNDLPRPKSRVFFRLSKTNAYSDGSIAVDDIVLDKGYLSVSDSPNFVKDFRGLNNASSKKVRFVLNMKKSENIRSVAGWNDAMQGENIVKRNIPFKVKKIINTEDIDYVELEEEIGPVHINKIKNSYSGAKYLRTNFCN